MSIFELMPSVWLLLSVFFFVFLAFFAIRHSAALLSASLLAMLFSFFAFPMHAQIFVFFFHTSLLFIADLFIKPKKSVRYCVSITDIDSHGGIVKYKNGYITAYCRDSSHHYKSGCSFKLQKGVDGEYYCSE